MVIRFFVLAGFLFVASWSVSSQVTQSVISELIQGLGNSSFEIREKSQRDLELLGEPALESLRIARKSDDPEVRRRADALVKKIEVESDNKKLITPKKITMKHMDVPVAEVVADLVKQSGYRIVLEDKSRIFETKKISVEIRDAPFWEALQTIARKADLVEIPGLRGTAGEPIKVEFPKANILPRIAPKAIPLIPGKETDKKAQPEKGVKIDEANPVIKVLFVPQEKGAPVPPAPPMPILPPGIGQVFGQVAIGLDQVPTGKARENVIILKGGKFDELPSDTLTAFRVRMLRNPENVFGKPDDKHILLGLEVSPEPRLKLHAISSVNITKAVDDIGQNLEQDSLAAKNDLPPFPGRIVARPVQAIDQIGNSVESKVPVHLIKGARESKVIDSIEGKLVLQVMDDSKPVLEVSNIEKEVGRKIEGKSGAWLKINECVKVANGSHSLKIEYDIPSDVAANVQNNFGIRNNIIIQNGQLNIMGGAAPASLGGFKIFDAEGKALTPNSSSTSISVGPGGTKRSINVTYPASSKAPHRILYDGGSTTMVEVPFALKMVPLK